MVDTWFTTPSRRCVAGHLARAAQEWGFRIGFSLVIMLMLVGTWNDLVRVATVWLGG